MKTLTDDFYKNEIRKFVKWAVRAAGHNLVQCSSGNLSRRLSNDQALVSQSRIWLGDIKNKNVVRVELSTGNVLQGKNPSGEFPLHKAVLLANPEINVVLHCQSPSATALACANNVWVDYDVIIEVPIYLGKVEHLPYLKPGSEELANAVAEATKTSGVIQLSNHGQVITGKTYREVFQKAVFFELACSIIIKNNFNPSTLSQDQISGLRGYR